MNSLDTLSTVINELSSAHLVWWLQDKELREGHYLVEFYGNGRTSTKILLE